MNLSLRRRTLFVIGVDGFSKQWGVFLHQIMPLFNSLLWERRWPVQLRCLTGLSSNAFKQSRKNNTRSNNQSEQTYGVLQVVINGTGIQQAQKHFNR